MTGHEDPVGAPSPRSRRSDRQGFVACSIVSTRRRARRRGGAARSFAHGPKRHSGRMLLDLVYEPLADASGRVTASPPSATTHAQVTARRAAEREHHQGRFSDARHDCGPLAHLGPALELMRVKPNVGATRACRDRASSAHSCDSSTSARRSRIARARSSCGRGAVARRDRRASGGDGQPAIRSAAARPTNLDSRRSACRR